MKSLINMNSGSINPKLISASRSAARNEEDIILKLKITIAGHVFDARFESDAAPDTCAAFQARLPFESQVVHVRWSGEAVWIPLGDLDFGVGYENHTSFPAPGQILLYPGGISETEIILAYGGLSFSSKMGQLASNHFITIHSGLENLRPLGERVLWKGAQPVRFSHNR